jgi:hypothetical protein
VFKTLRSLVFVSAFVSKMKEQEGNAPGTRIQVA